MKLVAEYLVDAIKFDRMAEDAKDVALKASFRKQAAEYRKLALGRAKRLGMPPPGLSNQHMIENFKRAMRGHVAPICTKCNEPMAWFRSDLDKTEPDTIVGFFHCQKCGARKEVRSKIQKPE